MDLRGLPVALRRRALRQGDHLAYRLRGQWAAIEHPKAGAGLQPCDRASRVVAFESVWLYPATKFKLPVLPPCKQCGDLVEQRVLDALLAVEAKVRVQCTQGHLRRQRRKFRLIGIERGHHEAHLVAPEQCASTGQGQALLDRMRHDDELVELASVPLDKWRVA